VRYQQQIPTDPVVSVTHLFTVARFLSRFSATSKGFSVQEVLSLYYHVTIPLTPFSAPHSTVVLNYAVATLKIARI